MRRTASLALAVALMVLAAGCGGGSTNWYAAGKAFTIADSKVDTSLLTGPVSIIGEWCSENLRLAKTLMPAQRPSDTSGTAGQEWLQGCEAGYRASHPGQLVENGYLYAHGTNACSASCRSHWYAAGKSLAISAGQSASTSTSNAQDAEEWCADLMFPDSPLPANIEDRLKADSPAPGPQTQAWASGCAAGYDAAQQAAPSPPPAPSAAPLSMNCAPVEDEPESVVDGSVSGWTTPVPSNGFGGTEPRQWNGTLGDHGWPQGASVGVTTNGFQQTRARIKVTFVDSAGAMVYTKTATVRLTDPGSIGSAVVPVGQSATGATRCTASVESSS
jgi:hypothetical protein